jgi:3-methylfumaryl-CoA hydratase
MDWKPTEWVITDTLNVPTAQFLAATLDRDDPLGAGDSLPDGWHWCYFLNAAKRSSLGYDGHAEKGGFLPPTDLPRRMWAGSQFQFHAPLRLGETIVRKSNVINVEKKQGKSGRLEFVQVEHRYFGSDGKPRMTERHDIVYRDIDTDPNPDKPILARSVPWVAERSLTITPDPVLLFRYSALTFNGHRIHYDVPFCREQEGYRHLVVHGPLVATLLMNFANDHARGSRMRAFEFKARSPLFCDAAFALHQRAESGYVQLWATNENGGLAMEARAFF